MLHTPHLSTHVYTSHYYSSLLSTHLPFFLAGWLIPTLPVGHTTTVLVWSLPPQFSLPVWFHGFQCFLPVWTLISPARPIYLTLYSSSSSRAVLIFLLVQARPTKVLTLAALARLTGHNSFIPVVQLFYSTGHLSHVSDVNISPSYRPCLQLVYLEFLQHLAHYVF
jgi:hypothetical protein